MIHPLPIQSKCRTWIIHYSCLLFISIPLAQIQAFPSAPFPLRIIRGIKKDDNAVVVKSGQEGQPTIRLEPGKPIEQKMAGGESKNYVFQVSEATHQYVEVLVRQQGIDVLIRLYGPNGKLITDFDSEIRIDKPEVVEWVAEEAGSYQLEVLAKNKNAPTGIYTMQIMEIRPAKEDDIALHEARRLNTEFNSLFRAGKFDEARPLIDRVLQIREGVLGPDHIDVARTLNNLATLYFSKGDITKAESLFKRAISIGEKSVGQDHPDFAAFQNNLGNLYCEVGEYAKAEELYQRALTIRQNSLGAEHPLVARSMTNLALVFLSRGDYEKAEPLYQHALIITEKSLGSENIDMAVALNNLALLYKQRLEYTKAEPLYERALKIGEKSLGMDHPDVIRFLINLAFLYKERGEIAMAEPLYVRALASLEKSLGAEHPLVGLSLYDFADLYRKKGDYAKSEMLYLRSVTILEKSLGPGHFFVARGLTDLAILCAAKGDITQALAYLSRANAADERNLELNLTTGSERQKLAYLELLSRQTDFALSLQGRVAQNNSQALELAFTVLLRRKVRGLEAMTDTLTAFRRRATPQDQDLFDRLKYARSRFASLTLKESAISNTESYAALKETVDNLEAELSARSSEVRKQEEPVTLTAVRKALPADSALIDFALFTPLELETGKTESQRFIAFVLAAGDQPKWVDLGEAAPIDRAVEAWREALRDPNRTDVKLLARSVDEKVMRPVRALLGETSHLLIAPDGKLNLIPFAALVDERNQYLIERYSMSYLTSGRDLLRLQTREPSREGPVVVANPDFGRFATIAMRTDRGAGKARSRLDLDQIFFQPLPGTEDEALAIKGLLPNATVLRREQATETALKHVRGPSILHIATHGFFLENNDPAPVEKYPLRIGSSETASLASSQANPYTVQLGSTPEFKAAEEKVNGLKTRGLNAYLVKSEVKGKGEYYRVRAGSFRTQDEAQKYGAELQKKGMVSQFFVARYEPPQRGLMEQTAKEPPSNLRLSKFATKVEDPLLRSGLALAGANQGKSGDDDGILTAAEAAYLDLLGTKLVILSACDTGVGEVKNGEGVQGLRRALILAGSESQIMTLWPISDDATKDLIIPYYRALQRGEGRGEGLRQVQLRMLHGRKDERHPFYWAAFIQSGEWANMDGRR